ncbi:MAG TPA: TlpA disulfide reductase family protein [Bryobacteraceae bacterium]|jgi:thiol-disulfide isomerase/thioredoxin|nr:TlpA disulfide reductase family protein [Bryobacteraceae bacterium]
MRSPKMLNRVLAMLVWMAVTLGAEPAPRFHAKSLDGENFSNDSVQGKVVLLQFWATWCKYCRGEQSVVDELTREFADRGLVVLAVDFMEPKKVVKKYLEQMPRACKVILTEDTNLAALYPSRSFPLYVVIDRDGNIAGTQKGAGGAVSLRRLLRKAGLE